MTKPIDADVQWQYETALYVVATSQDLADVERAQGIVDSLESGLSKSDIERFRRRVAVLLHNNG